MVSPIFLDKVNEQTHICRLGSHTKFEDGGQFYFQYLVFVLFCFSKRIIILPYYHNYSNGTCL